MASKNGHKYSGGRSTPKARRALAEQLRALRSVGYVSVHETVDGNVTIKVDDAEGRASATIDLAVGGDVAFPRAHLTWKGSDEVYGKVLVADGAAKNHLYDLFAFGQQVHMTTVKLINDWADPDRMIALVAVARKLAGCGALSHHDISDIETPGVML